jgi:hypothetical protein
MADEWDDDAMSLGTIVAGVQDVFGALGRGEVAVRGRRVSEVSKQDEIRTTGSAVACLVTRARAPPIWHLAECRAVLCASPLCNWQSTAVERRPNTE